MQKPSHKTARFIEYIESQVNNKNKVYFCDECNEADEKIFKVIQVSKDFTKALDRIPKYYCMFHAKLKFPYWFKSKSKSKSKSKNQIQMFEAAL